ncbi:MAG: hybrid sensor histidine kinase/response regulator [Polyangiaceae bacterium]
MPGAGKDEDDPNRLTDERATSATMRAASVTGAWLEEDTRDGLAEDREDASGAHDRRILADRLSAVETLAAGLAHEINNPLTYTLINVESMLRRMRVLAAAPPSAALADEMTAALPSFVESLDQTLHGLRRVRQVVRSVMTFSRGGIGASKPVDVRGLVESATQMALHEVVHRARLTRDLREVPPVMANDSALGHVFLGLIVNAAQAIPLGDARENEVRVSTRVDDDGQVVIEVSDTGAGIAPDVLPRIFDPFFTSKGTDKASGLGLSVAYGTVRRFGGDIKVSSVLGVGTTFRVVLPPVKGWRGRDAAPPGEAGVAERRRVIVVDDERMVGESVARTLRDVADVTVVTEAAAVVQMLADGQRWDSILCDLLMPEMSGIDLYRETLRIAPDAAPSIVFMTAGAFTPHAQAFLESVSNPWLEKPFDIGKLRSLIARAPRR